MQLEAHPFGRPYFHIPSGKVIYLQNKYSDGTYAAHFQYRESLTVNPDDLRLPTISEIRKDYPGKILSKEIYEKYL